MNIKMLKFAMIFALSMYSVGSGILVAGENALASAKSGEKIDWQVISSGGTEGGSESFELKGTVAQTAIGKGSSTSFIVGHGFWMGGDAGPGPCQGECGDANNDQNVNVSDGVWIINYVFAGGDPPQPVLACGDANGEGAVNIADGVWIINYVFAGGDSPGNCAPGSPAWNGNDCCPFEE